MPLIPAPDGTSELYSYEIPLRWSDFDQYQHVNNSVYLEFSQDARAAYARDGLAGNPQDNQGLEFPPMFVRKATLDYIRPISNHAKFITITTGVKRIGNTSFTLFQWVYDDSQNLAATIECVMVLVDAATGSPIPIDDEVRHGLETTLIADAS